MGDDSGDISAGGRERIGLIRRDDFFVRASSINTLISCPFFEVTVAMKTEHKQALFDIFADLVRQLDDAETLCDLTFGRSLDAIVGRRPLDNTLLIMIDKADARGLLPRLIVVARQYFADTEGLRAFAEELQLDEGKGQLERCLFTHCPPADVDRWRHDMVRCERAVCRIEAGSGTILGTGALIGPDLVVTNRHVIDWFDEKKVPLSELRARFDCKVDGNGGTVLDGKVHRLASSTIVAESPKNELDFALLRLATRAGEEQPTATREARRGWLVPDYHQFQVGEPLSIMQHPNGNPLKFAFGSVTGSRTAPERVDYTVNTEKGSSGSPCFTPDWKLVALHRSGTDKRNSGIPWSAILTKLSAAGITLPDPP